jgi:hypothetical protein
VLSRLGTHAEIQQIVQVIVVLSKRRDVELNLAV